MRVRRVRLDTDGNFTEQTDMNHLDMNQNLADILAGEGVSMVTITFDDGRETLWSKLPDMKRTRPMEKLSYGG